MQNPPSLSMMRITPRCNLGVVQQRALPIPLPPQLPTHDQSLPEQIASGIAAAQVQPPIVPSSSVQQVGQPIAGEVYTMADLHNLAITQGR